MIVVTKPSGTPLQDSAPRGRGMRLGADRGLNSLDKCGTMVLWQGCRLVARMHRQQRSPGYEEALHVQRGHNLRDAVRLCVAAAGGHAAAKRREGRAATRCVRVRMSDGDS